MTSRALNALFELPRGWKRSLQVLADGVLLASSFALAMLLRTESAAFLTDPKIWAALIAALPVTFILFVRLGFYRAVIRYMAARALATIVQGVAASALALGVMSSWLELPIPATVPVIYAVLALVTVGGVRFVLRELYNRTQSRLKSRVIIYGAGQSGRQTAHSLFQGNEHVPVAFVDDNPELWGIQIAGLRVFSPKELERLIHEYQARQILLAMPSATRAVRAEILRRLEHLPLKVQTIPGMAELVMGKAKVSEISEVSVEDLMGRDPVPPVPALMQAAISGKAVMVTGAGGSIGSELCRLILCEGPSALVLVEQSEYALYQIMSDLEATSAERGLQVPLVPVLASVRDGGRMENLMRAHQVETIYHAAAYKHVPMVEANGVEGIANNVFGTLECARAAIAAGVERFTLVSTDKAVRPTSLMGASKRMAELVCQAMAMNQGRTVFAMVRFGNVLGSSGSVIPLFRRQIASGGPVTVTHPAITRYFMTVTEAAQLVIQAAALARGGDVFLLDMGEPVRIAKLAERMIRLSGFTPVIVPQDEVQPPLGPDVIPIVFTRLRPGEKMFEELLIAAPSEPTLHPRILSATETALDWARLATLLDALRAACDADDVDAVRHALMEAPIGYTPRKAGAVRQLIDARPERAPVSDGQTVPALPLVARVGTAGR